MLLGLIREALHDRPLPIIGMAGAGNWAAALEDPGNDVLNVPMQIGAGGRFVVEVFGESMNLLLPPGSYAVIDPDDRELYVGKLYLLQSHEGEATIKRYRADPARFEPVSDNSEFQPFGIHDFEFRVIGRVTAGMLRFN
ncbi:MAG TPA: S24 family peptidase [Sphingomicrobium sp.]